MKIISIEFAPNEAVMAQFFGSVIMGVNADRGRACGAVQCGGGGF